MDDQYPRQPDETTEQTSDNTVMDSILPPVKPKHIVGGILKVLLVIIVVAALIGAAVWFFTKHKASTPTTTKPTTSSTKASSPKIASATTHYDSTNYNLGLDYPRDWTVADEATAKLTVTSPALQLTGNDGRPFSGQIQLAVQNQQTSLMAFAANKAVAAIESQKISYKTPTPNQRAQTYVTFVSYAGLTSAIDALYITGDNGYQAGQDVPQADVIKADPLVTVSFLKCADAACKTAGTATPIAAKSWSDKSLSAPVLSLLESLAFE